MRYRKIEQLTKWTNARARANRMSRVIDFYNKTRPTVPIDVLLYIDRKREKDALNINKIFVKTQSTRKNQN